MGAPEDPKSPPELTATTLESATQPAPANDHPVASAEAPAARPTPAQAPEAPAARRKWIRLGSAAIVLALVTYLAVPTVLTKLNTISTDDAYVNGHVTLAAPRVGGQIKRVLVDDNFRVKKGDLLVELDK